ncbi:lipopolysaccharide biosynthesis protein [Plantibacter sp. Mn2098]|uniref:lipopolysaccharide biosynthesis protein n=1 Tax=Plantibacter sp. Mn2098 TaxID=3395266 RepID=UPI003BC5B078
MTDNQIVEDSGRHSLADQPSTKKLSRLMIAGATGPLLSFAVLFALPLIGAWLLPAREFALWSILSSISTISLSLDFGGVALTMARLGFERRLPLLLRSSALSASGSALIGIVAMAAWIPYSTTEAAAGFTLSEGLWAIGLTSLASCLRSGLMVLAQAALNDEKFLLRNFITAGQSILAFTITVGYILHSGTAWALPLGWALSSAIVLVVAIPWAARTGIFTRSPQDTCDMPVSARTRTFIWSRTVATIIGALLLQSDRWIVGAIAGPQYLAAYEVAWRLASMPKFLIQNLSVVTGSSAATMRASGARRVAALIRHSTLISAAAGGVAILLFTFGYWAATSFLGKTPLWPVFVAMIVVFTLHGLTAPLSFVGIGIGLPAIDIPYLLATAVLSLAAVAVGFGTANVELYVYGNLAALFFGVIWFFGYGSKRIQRDLNREYPLTLTS